MTKLRPTPLSAGMIQDALRRFQAEVSPQQTDQIRLYISLLLKWNQAVSLTSVTQPADILSRHFGESLFAASVVELSHGRLADVGSGAGFPGLALKILEPRLDITLIESNGRKCSFLKEIARSLDLDGVTVIQQRLEQYEVSVGSFDFVCARAFGQFKNLLTWSWEALGPTGALLLWVGQDDSMSLSAHPGWGWDNPRKLPGSERRFILKGRPSGP